MPVSQVSRCARCYALAAALLWLGVLPAGALVRMDVFLGYDGLAAEGAWFPVAVEVENDGPSFDAVFELSPGQYGEGQTRVMAIELPTDTVKRFVLPVFASSRYRSTWTARILDSKGKIRAENPNIQMRRQIQRDLPLVGAITRTSAGLPIFPEVKSRQSEWQPGVARLQPVLFPDNPIALEGLTAIYLHSERALELKVPQVNALMAWLNAGGHLVVGIEQLVHVNGNEWLRRLLPCDLTNLVSSTSHAALEEWLRGSERFDGTTYLFSTPSARNPRRRTPQATNQASSPFANPFMNLSPDPRFNSTPLQVARGTMRGAEILIGTAEDPLILTSRRGRGQVTVLLFSPELEPFLSWRNREQFWARMADLPPLALVNEQYVRYQPYSVDGVFGAMVDSKQVRKLPVFALLLLLVGYLVVIGPLDQYWLKKINRQMLTWITFPIYVACFSGLIYLIGYKLRAGETEWNEINVVDVFPAGGQAEWRGWTFGSIYSPVNTRYKFSADLPLATLRGEYLRSSFRGGQETTRAAIEQRGNAFAAEIPVPVWTSQLLVSDWWRRAESPVGIRVVDDANAWQVTITNATAAPLQKMYLFVGGRAHHLGELPARQSKDFTVAKSSGEAIDNFALQHGETFIHAVQQRQLAFGDTFRLINVPESSMAASFSSVFKDGSSQYGGGFLAPPGIDLSPIVAKGDAVLMAWAPGYAPSKGITQFTARRTQRDTLFRVSQPLN